jgi:hypothetical protein
LKQIAAVDTHQDHSLRNSMCFKRCLERQGPHAYEQDNAARPQQHDLHEDVGKRHVLASEVKIEPEKADPHRQGKQGRRPAKRAETAAVVFEKQGFEGGFGKGFRNRQIAYQAPARVPCRR